MDDKIIRRISRKRHVIWDEDRECWRISSMAYSTSSGQNGGMSVDIESLIVKDGINPEDFVTNNQYPASVSFTAEQIRALGLLLGSDPTPDNPYHGQVWKGSSAGRFTPSQARRLSQAAAWYLPMPDVSLT